MPCPCCGEDPEATAWHPDPLRWELDPPCTEAEWNYLKDLPMCPEYMHHQEVTYMNNICRGCYNQRLEVMRRVRVRIRDNGGLEEMNPSMRMRKEYEKEHANDIVSNRPAKIKGLLTAASLNGQVCKLLKKDEESGRWTVELLDGTQKSLKEANLETSNEIDIEWMTEKSKLLHENPELLKKEVEKREKEAPRPLGAKTTWPKVKGVHPGAVVRIHSLTGATHLNGRKGRCVTFDPETGRWKVDLGDEFKSLKPANFSPAPGEKPPTRESALKEKKELEQEEVRKNGLSAREEHGEGYGWDG